MRLSGNISRRGFMKQAALTATAALAVPKGGVYGANQPEPKPAGQSRNPNIILYVTDDHGFNDAGCYGNPVIKTPGLDALAAEGMRFTHAFCTTASCSPSRAVILSGLHNHASGQYGLLHKHHHFYSFDNVQSLPVLLNRAGYRTAKWGKYHVAPETVYHFEQTVEQGDSPSGGAENCRTIIEPADSRPFFLYFCTKEPHRPFKREGSDEVDPENVIVPPYLPDIKQCRQELSQYYGSVQRADSGLLELIKILKETGRWNDTVIIYCSDNGIPFPGAKTTVYEPGIRLPFVVRDPYSKKQGDVCDAMISYVDITPTILDYAGAADAGPFHGKSFRKVLQNSRTEGFDEVYASHTFHEVTMYYPMRAVRTRRYKLIWNIAHGLEYPFASDLWGSSTWQAVLKDGREYYGKRKVKDYINRPPFELYDLEKDPDEINNLAQKPEYDKLLRELKDKLKAFQKRTEDPWIIKWERE